MQSYQFSAKSPSCHSKCWKSHFRELKFVAVEPLHGMFHFYRQGSRIWAIVQLHFPEEVTDPLQPLRDAVSVGRLGPFTVEQQLDLSPSTLDLNSLFYL